MKKKVNSLLNWFETKFNYFIELLAFIGGVFSIFLAVFLFVAILINIDFVNDIPLEAVFLPGIIGFFGVIILFALRITRHLTK